ncbi:MAG TPA: MASE1 domain-containing protein [Thermoplasmata archaeon]|nr:MASE1 domain-containing protein [Thermoplasmata archaeon]
MSVAGREPEPSPTEPRPGLWPRYDARSLLILSTFALTYFVAGRAGLLIAFPNSSVSAVWPATGIAIAGLVLVGYRYWPAIAVGAFVYNISVTGDPLSSLAIAGGNVLEGLVGAYLALRFAGGPAAADSPESVLAFSTLAVLPAAAISAFVGNSALAALGHARVSAFPTLWAIWWIGDSVGGIEVGLLIFLALSAFRDRRWARPRRNAAIELLALGVATAVAFDLVFYPPSAVFVNGAPAGIIFLLLPLLVWAAFRFGRLGAAGFAVACNAIALGATLGGVGAFAKLPRPEALVAVQLFVGSVALTGLLVGAERYQRGRLTDELEESRSTLEQRVRERTAALDTAQSVGHVGTWELDVATRRVSWSDEMYHIFGFGSERPPLTLEQAFAGVHPTDRVASRQRLEEYLRSAETMEELPFQKLRILWPNGEVHYVETAARVLTSEDRSRRQIVGVMIDVTDREQILRELKAGQDELVRSNRDLAQFAYVASHDLQEPLGTIEGYGRLLDQRCAGQLDPQATEYLRQLRSSTARMRTLIDDLLDLGRMGTGRDPPQEVSMEAAVDEALERLRRALDESRAEVRRETPLPAVLGRKEDMVRLWQNLLSNAIKFRDHVGPVVRVRADPGAVGFRFSVCDNGIGIPPEFQGQIFDVFRRLHTRQEYAGNGMGLAICKKIVEAHHGQIGVESTGRPGDGTTFWFSVPAVPPAGPPT